MESEKFPELIQAAGGSLAEKMNLMREKAEHFIAEHVEVMKEQGKAVELGEDELRLLTAYRAFKNRSPSGAVFSWKIPTPEGIVIPTEPCLIQDPRQVV